MPERFKFHSDEEYVHTLAHEVAHSTLKDTRLNRQSSGVYGSRDYAIEELRAEIASSFYLAEFGLVDGILQKSLYPVMERKNQERSQGTL